MPQQTLHTKRITLVPLADEHLELEVELDSDREVMRYLSGRASTREEVEAAHARRLAAARKVDGLGLWAGPNHLQFSKFNNERVAVRGWPQLANRPSATPMDERLLRPRTPLLRSPRTLSGGE